MYKNIELLSKSNHKDLTFSPLDSLDFAKDVKLVTLGLSEVTKLSSLLPVVISGGEEQHFIVFSGVSNQNSYFSENRCKDIYIPMLLKSYPFLMIDTYEQGNSERKLRAVALDTQSDFIGADKKYKLFEKENVLSKQAQHKVQMVQNFDKDKINSLKFIAELKKYNLLDKKSFDIKLEDGSTKSILKDFYVVSRERLYQLDDEVILKWAKGGFLHILEAHINSIQNINTLLNPIIEQTGK